MKAASVAGGETTVSSSAAAGTAGHSSRSTTPSPPVSSSTSHMTSDEGVEVECRSEELADDPVTGISQHHQSRRSVLFFKCTYPACDAEYRQNKAIERHVRQAHAVDAGEELFYYTEVEGEEVKFARHVVIRNNDSTHIRLYSPSNETMNSNSNSSSGCGQSPVQSPGPVFALTASAPTWSHLDMARPPHEDPEYQRQLKQKLSSPIAIPGISFTHHEAFIATPHSKQQQQHNKFMRIGEMKVSPGSGGSSLLQSGQSASPKGRRGRGDTRKCRKVYGMESRDQWCTQCKWKKACTRFHD